MSTKFYKFNQGGVGRDLMFGKQGGTIKWDATDNKFTINNSAGGSGTMVEIRPLASTEYSTGAISKNITDQTLVTAGYVKGLIQGFRTKASVQTVAVDKVAGVLTKVDLPVGAFNRAVGFSKDPDAVMAGLTIKVYQAFGLREMGQPDGTLTPAQKQALQDNIIRGRIVEVRDPTDPTKNVAAVAGLRILVKDQTNPTQNGIYELVDAGSASNFYLERTVDMDVEDEAEGAYVYVQGGVLEGTGWLGEVAGIPDSVNDPYAPVLGTKAVKFTQFHGQGNYVGAEGIRLDERTFKLNYQQLPEIADAGADKAKIESSYIAVQYDVAGAQTYNKIKFGTALEAYGLHHWEISDRKVQGNTVRVAGGPDQKGSVIEFITASEETTGRSGDHTALQINGGVFALDYTDNAFTPNTDTLASTIIMKAGHQSGAGTNANAKGGNIELTAGNGVNTSRGGNIILTPGISTGGTTGVVHINSDRFVRIPVGTDSARGLSSLDGVDATIAAEYKGALRMSANVRNEGIDVLEYCNGKEWVQIEGASFMIHDDKQANEPFYDTFISAAGFVRDAAGKIAKTDTDAIDAVVDGLHLFSLGKETQGLDMRSLGKVLISAGNGSRAAIADTGLPLVINTIGANETGDTFVARMGALSSGAINIHTGHNTTATGGKSGEVKIESGDHSHGSGNIVLETGDIAAGATGVVGDVIIRTGLLADALEDAKAGSILIGAAKAGTVARHNIVIGTPVKTMSTKVHGKVIDVGVTNVAVNEATTSINIGSNGGAANNTGAINLKADNVEVSATNAANVQAKNIHIGTNATTTEIQIGYVGANGAGVRDHQAEVKVAGQNVEIVADGTMTFTNTNENSTGTVSGIKFDTGVSKDGGGLITSVGMLSVAASQYTDHVSKPEHIPNVGYLQKVMGTGELGGSGTRILDIAKVYRSKDPAGVDYALGTKLFQVGSQLPKGARITRVSITVLNKFGFATPAISTVKVYAAPSAGGTKTMLMDSKVPGVDSDFDIVTSLPGDVYIGEFGSLRAGDQRIFCEFDEAPDTTTGNGEISIVVEFVNAPYVETESV